MDQPSNMVTTHYDTATGQWVAWVQPWQPGNPIGRGQNEIAAKDELARLVEDSDK